MSDETRDIRFTRDEIKALTWGIREEIKKRTRSIEKANANRAAGGTVKHGILDEHHRMLAASRSALEALRVAERQLDHKAARP